MAVAKGSFAEVTKKLSTAKSCSQNSLERSHNKLVLTNAHWPVSSFKVLSNLIASLKDSFWFPQVLLGPKKKTGDGCRVTREVSFRH